MRVAANVDWSIALYCQRCGKLHIHDFSYFVPMDGRFSLRCACGHGQAALMRTGRKGLLLEVPCVVCGFVHRERFSLKEIIRMKAEKVYCARDHFELGYVGKRARIEEILAFNKRVFASLAKDHGTEQIEKQQIMLDVLNRLHDIAEKGGICCNCGDSDVSADIVGNYVVLECCTCGSYHIISAGTEEDLEKLNHCRQIELLQRRYLNRNIDLD